MTKQQTKNIGFVFGVLIMCVGMQLANYGTAVCVTGEITRLNATDYLTLISCMGSMGMMLILPVAGKFTAILGLRNMILTGILIQVTGRIGMMFAEHWVLFTLAYLLQAIGGGCYVSSAYVNMSSVVQPSERAKYFGYIAVANAIGAIFGPILVSNMYAAGGLMAKLAYIANLPLTIIGFLLIFKNCSNSKTPGATKGFDYPGLLLTVVGLASLVLWMNLSGSGKMFDWISLPSLFLLALTVISMVLMIKRELTIPNAAVPVKMFKNPRLTFAFIGALIGAVFSTCSSTYCVVWSRANFYALPGAATFNGTATLAQQIVVFVLGLFLGAYVSKKFKARFRIFGVASMAAAVLATAILYCLKFTGTAAAGNLMLIGSSFPVGMILIYLATAIGGFTSVVAQSTFSAFWQSNTPKEEIPSGQALYGFASTGGSVIFSAVVGVVLGTSGDFSRAFLVGMIFSIVGLICAVIGFKFPEDEKI